MIHYHMEKTYPTIKDGGKPLNSRIYLQKLKKNVLVELWQKYFKIPTGLTNADMKGRKKNHVKISDIMPTSKGEGRIRENLKCAEKQAASARAVPERTDFIHLYFRTKRGRQGKKYWKSSLLGGCVSMPLTYFYLKHSAWRDLLMLEKKVLYHNNIVLQQCPQSGCSGIYKPSSQIDSNELLTRGCQQSC